MKPSGPRSPNTAPIPVLLMVRGLTIGGCERDLTKIALALDRSRFDPHVGCFRPEGPRYEELKAAGVPILALPVRSFANLSVLAGVRELARYIRTHRIRLIHAFDVPTSVFAAIACGVIRGPAMITAQLSYRNLYTPSMRRLLKIADRLADRIVVNSKAVIRSLCDEEGLAPDRISLIYNGVDTTVFHPHGRRRPELLANAPLVVGTVCALRSEKRLDLLIHAFARVRLLLPGMKLVIVGSGDVLPVLQKLRTDHGLGDDCILHPQTTQVADWLRAIDIFVLCSESESFPNALLEAMACGCCVVGSDVGGVPELVSSGINGFTFKSGSEQDLVRALSQAVQDSELRRSFGAAAATTAHDHFSIEIAARRTEAVYDSVLSDEPAGDCAGASGQSTLK